MKLSVKFVVVYLFIFFLFGTLIGLIGIPRLNKYLYEREVDYTKGFIAMVSEQLSQKIGLINDLEKDVQSAAREELFGSSRKCVYLKV
ncbi:MAG: hypothetical protein U9O87_09205 [Verrucomicrobiota bacterium]|nr:hypothetical protein [Verrucomicrobiota bacterium]